jgi:hypothetical protein
MPKKDDILSSLQSFINNYPDEEILILKNSSEEELYRFHRGLGMALRNSFFWGECDETLNEYTKSILDALGRSGDFHARKRIHPDGMSADAIYYIWAWLNGMCK